MVDTILQGNCREVLKTLPDGYIDCIVTSPPYWRMRDYGNDKQIGLEETMNEYINKLIIIFNECKRVLKSNGTFWLNLGDSYSGAGYHAEYHKNPGLNNSGKKGVQGKPISKTFLKSKDLIGIPWRVAFALQSDGWYLRSDIIWYKPNPMPESVKDRPTRSHEYIFLFSKNRTYYYDIDAIKEPFTDSTYKRINQKSFYEQTGGEKDYSSGINKNRSVRKIAVNIANKYRGTSNYGGGGNSFKGHSGNYNANGALIGNGFRNKRSVWIVNSQPFPKAHFAVYPGKLIAPCIKAGCPENGIVLDPFFGSGTTGLVSKKLGRHFIGIELNPEYIKIARNRIDKYLDGNLFELYEL